MKNLFAGIEQSVAEGTETLFIMVLKRTVPQFIALVVQSGKYSMVRPPARRYVVDLDQEMTRKSDGGTETWEFTGKAVMVPYPGVRDKYPEKYYDTHMPCVIRYNPTTDTGHLILEDFDDEVRDPSEIDIADLPFTATTQTILGQGMCISTLAELKEVTQQKLKEANSSACFWIEVEEVLNLYGFELKGSRRKGE